MQGQKLPSLIFLVLKDLTDVANYIFAGVSFDFLILKPIQTLVFMLSLQTVQRKRLMVKVYKD